MSLVLNNSRVVHVSTVRVPREVRVFFHECLSLRDAGYDVDLVVHNGDHDEVVDGIFVRTLGPLRKARRGLLVWPRLRAIFQAARRILETDAAIVHLHDPELIPVGWWLRLTSKRRIIYDSAENYTAYMGQKYYLSKPVRWMLTHFMATLETIAARSFDAVITADAGTTAIFVNRRAKRVVTLHNFPTLAVFDGSESVADAEKQYDLVYHGTIPKYHLEVAFEVATELRSRGRHAKWLFFGVCNDMGWANEEIRRRGLQDSFQIQGRVEHNEVASLVAQARIGFIPLPDLPKFHQNIPMKLFEFMALRMPTVLSDLPPSRPFAGDGKAAIMVPPGDIVAYADVIERLLEDHDLRNQLGAEGRRRVEQEYNWTTESQKLLRLYEELLTGSSPPEIDDKTRNEDVGNDDIGNNERRMKSAERASRMSKQQSTVPPPHAQQRSQKKARS